MPKPRSVWANPTVALPMAAVGLLLILFLTYYFPVSARQEASLNNRAFRSLAAVGDQVQKRVVTYAGILEQAAKKNEKVAITAYLGEQVPEIDLVGPTAGADCAPEATTLGSRQHQEHYDLELTCGKWRAESHLERTLAPYLRGGPDQLFDEILLTDDEGEVLFQTVKTGNRIKHLPATLLPTSPPADQKAPASSAGVPSFSASSRLSSLQSLRLADTDYKVFLIPVLLGLPATSASTQTKAGSPYYLVLCGFIQERRFRAESMGVPGGALILAVLVLLVVILATWPYLKYQSMTATHHVPRRTAQYFFLSSLATIMLGGILVIHVRYTLGYDRAVDDNLEHLANAIDRNLEKELKRTLLVMDDIDHSALLRRDNCTIEEGKPPQPPAVNVLAENELQLSDYPYFDRIFWSDKEGKQRIKWEVSEYATPATQVKKRPYFQATVNSQLWRFTDPGLTDHDRFSHPDRLDPRFRVDPLFSLNTGHYVAVISKKGRQMPSCQGTVLSVVSMVSPLLSLIDPILPPDYGFALVDDDGDVLFHSNSTKNGQENFYHESGDEEFLRASVLARQGKHLTVEYLGYEHRLFATPLQRIQQAPWTLIVFRNLSAAYEQHVERIVLFAWLVLLYYAAISLIVVAFPPTQYPPDWLWPTEDKQGMYLRAALSLLVVIPAFYLLIFELTSGVLLGAAFVIPAVGVAVAAEAFGRGVITRAVAWTAIAAFLLFVAYRAWFGSQSLNQGIAAILIVTGIPLARSAYAERLVRRIVRPSLPASFTAACALMLILVGVLPSIAFFKVAYDYYENLSTRRQQVQTMEALAEREQRVKQRYSTLHLSSQQTPDGQEDTDKWLFIRRRLEESLDRYDTAFLNLEAGPIFSPGQSAAFKAADEAGSGQAGSPLFEHRIAYLKDSRTPEDKLPRMLVGLAGLVPYGAGSLTRHLGERASEESIWTWSREATNRIRVHQMHSGGEQAYSSAPTMALFKSVTNDPVFLSPDLVSELSVLKPVLWIWAAAVFIVVWLIIFWWIKPTVLRMFLIGSNWRPALPEIMLGEDTPVERNLIILTLDSAHAARVLSSRKDVFSVDMAAMLGGTSALPDNIAEPIVAILHFEHQSSDRAADERKLRILEELADKYPGKKLVIIAGSDPVFHLEGGSEVAGKRWADGAAPAQDMDRWWRILHSFDRVRASSEPSWQPIDRWRASWTNSTTTERVALYQLARNGWVNPRSKAALDHLHQRGLIEGTPLRFVDNDFQDYILSTVHPDERRFWKSQDTVSFWEGIRLMFFVLAIGLVAAVLFFKQESISGFVLTGVGVLTALTQLFTQARSFGSLFGFKKEEQKS